MTALERSTILRRTSGPGRLPSITPQHSNTNFRRDRLSRPPPPILQTGSPQRIETRGYGRLHERCQHNELPNANGREPTRALSPPGRVVPPTDRSESSTTPAGVSDAFAKLIK